MNHVSYDRPDVVADAPGGDVQILWGGRQLSGQGTRQGHPRGAVVPGLSLDLLPRGLGFGDLRYPAPVSTLDVVDIDGVPVVYVQAGPGQGIKDGQDGQDGQDGPCLVLIHGLGSYLPVYGPILPLLAARCRVVALDLPGYGKSGKAGVPCTMTYFAGVIDRVIDALGLKRVVLCGHSMGGQIALTHALQRPGRAEALVLLAPAGLERFTETEAGWLRAAVTQRSVMETPPEMVAANLLANFSQMPEAARFMIEDRVQVIGGPDIADYAEAVARSVRGMLAEPVLDRLGEIAAPVLMIFGAEDRFIPNPVLHRGSTAALAEEGVARLQRGRLAILPRAGHMIQFERPRDSARLILDFLSTPP
jgi:pimeloyl-ACP methyl ester carboxylesterase